MPYHVSIDLKDDPDGGYCVDGVEDPKKYIASAKKEGGFWLGLDAFIAWDSVAEVWFHDEDKIGQPQDEDDEPNGNKVQTIN